MAKKIKGFIKLQVPAGSANPAPPVGPALGQYGVNIMEFCKAFNELTKSQPGMIIPVEITVYADRTFTFITKTPPASILLKKAAGLAKGSGEPNREKVGTVTQKDLEDIARVKMEDLNAVTIEAGARIIEGTAKSMGIQIAGRAGNVEITVPDAEAETAGEGDTIEGTAKEMETEIAGGGDNADKG